MRREFTIVFFLVLLSSFSCYAQAVGFGCLGFVGGYAGYSYQRYTPSGLNSYIESYNQFRSDSSLSPMDKFGAAKGYRVGLNLFRANLEGFILTTKGFYQFLTEKHDASITTSAGNASATYKMEIKNWGIGIDLGTSITSSFSWKVIDASVLYTSASLTDTRNYPDAITIVNEYSSESSTFGYSIGTGFIFELIDEYISLEGLAAFTVFSVDKVSQENIPLTVNEQSDAVMQNFIESGGFNAVIQLNIGFPL